MNEIAPLSSAKAQALETRLEALGRPAGAFAPARANAAARLAAVGLPGARDEYWRFTRPHLLNAARPVQTPVVAPVGGAALFADVERLEYAFPDGVFDAAMRVGEVPEGVEITRLAEAGEDHWAAPLYGTLEEAGQNPVSRPQAMLNTAYATDGLLVRVAGKAALPLSLFYPAASETGDAMLHNVIVLEEGAELTLLENGPGGARINSVTEVFVADGARFHHVRAQGRANARQAVTHLFARLGKESVFKSFTLSVNGQMTRNECVVEMNGDDAVAHVAGAALGDGALGKFHHDDTVFITHEGRNCESRQVFKKVLRNGAVGVFQGKILVKQSAQKTDGYQKSQSLLLDGDSQFFAKPELEIYADDVACSHGSTSGAIDEEGLFYLRSRGVPTDIATDLLVLAFVADALEEIEDAELAEHIRARLEDWLAGRRKAGQDTGE
ncbi:MAG: Fe-S cluster assembly protein SufD [Rhodobacterales bacterium]|nr:MAG: Fe-S cluster assembly protein SufD [Rhodobacterales bacterium]